MLFQFRLGRIPIQVHFSHLLFAGLLGWWFTQDDLANPGWPGSAYAVANQSAQGRLLFAVVLAWVAIIFVSVLVHELGHAVSSLAFGYQPSIQLIGLGGNTRPNARGPIPWWRDVLLTAAGPTAGLLLGLSCLGASFFAHSGPAHYVLGRAASVNLFWTVLNVLPVTPLDGGRISSALCMRAFGRRGFLVAQVISLTLAGAVVVWGLQHRALFIAVMVGWFGLASVQMIMAYLRGDAPATPPNDPHAIALAQAAALYREGKLADAKRLAAATLDVEVTPPVRSRLHHLLGWVALKEGEGRLALDHFAQVQGRPVEPHALAAAFSLVGDDERSLNLWEHAYRETSDRTVLHEWAGALLRLGRAEQAKRLPGVDLTQAYGCAERVLFIRGDFARAARMGAEAFELSPSAERAYDTACAFARAGEPEEALRLLQRAVSLGFDDARYAESDEDLATLRGNSAFQELLARMRPAAS
jgi:Zn-dependent protease